MQEQLEKQDKENIKEIQNMEDEDKQELKDDIIAIEDYSKMMEEMDKEDDRQVERDNQEYDEQALEMELQELADLERYSQQRKDGFYRKREARSQTRKRGGLRQENPFFDED
mmetsp:Transcript_17813/g.27567  ORF Transcript_17813/g.27567 Transcript_17813/m.27567 type:complete len:112 (-) Transcript_17813:21-356(-)